MPNYGVSDEKLAEAVAASTKMAEVLAFLGLKYAGGTHALYRKRIKRLGLDTSHFPGSKSSQWTGNNKKSPDEILINRPDGVYRASTAQLRRALKEIGIPYKCFSCGQDPVWNGKPLTLQVEHINGDNRDDRRENLCFLCPNCHTQTVTYSRIK
jgi:hypothetical protein